MKKTNSILLLFVLCLSITDVCAQKVIVTNDTFRMKCLKELIREAQKGDAEALYLVGRHCIAGEAIYEDEDLGISYIYKSAGQNYAPALYYIACQLHDTGDTESSIRYYKETLLHYEQSDSAHVSLECVCTEIWDIAVSLCSGTVEEYLDIVYNMTPEALELFMFLSNHDNDALSLLITYYLRKKNYEKHLEYAMKAYERGMVSRAGFTLGEIYYYGLGVDKDLSKAIAYYEYGAKEGNDYVCRQRLSDIFYEEKMVDKMFQYSYDYAHGDRISHDSSSGNVLQRLQACYRFGRGTDRNETLAKLWAAVSAWYYTGESVVEFESDINVENPKELETYIYSIILKELEKNNINDYACVSLLKGLYMLNVCPDYVAVRKLLVDAYNMEDVSRTDRMLIGYLLHIYSFSSTEVREIMKSFEEKVGITLNELKEEDNDEIDNCIYRLWVECIVLIEEALSMVQTHASSSLLESTSSPSNIIAAGEINGHEYVDLGLSVKWATCNVGASSPSDYGNYYAWGEISTKRKYNADNCKTGGNFMECIEGNPSNDAARANWGGTWRLPSRTEFQELVDRCTWVWTTQGGHNGYCVTGPNGGSIFLPAAGWRYKKSCDFAESYGYYWSSTPSGEWGAYDLDFNQKRCADVDWSKRDAGRSIRPVSD